MFVVEWTSLLGAVAASGLQYLLIDITDRSTTFGILVCLVKYHDLPYLLRPTTGGIGV